MNTIRPNKSPRIKERVSGKLAGPILLGTSLDNQQRIYMFSFSEVIVCDWLTHDENWLQTNLVIDKSSGRCFPKGSVRDITVSAWPCSMSDHSEEDGGWAVDGWRAIPVEEVDGEYIQITLKVAIRGVGSRLNRFGYMWVAYTTAI